MSKHPLYPILIALCLLFAGHGCQTGAAKPPVPAVDPSTLSSGELEKMADGLVGQQGKAEEALAAYGRALEKGGDPARIKYKQGFVLLREGRWTSASERFEEALSLAPEDVQTLQGAAYAAFRLADYARAESRLSRAVSIRPDLPGAHNLLGIVHNYLKRPELAVADFKAAIALSGPNPDLQNNLGIAYFMQRDFVHAEEAFRLGLAKGPNQKASNNLGLALCGQKKFDAAFEAFKTAGGEAAAYNNTGVCLADAGQRDRAAEYFNKAVELSPKYYAAAERNLDQAGGRETALEAMTMQALPAGEIAPSPKVAERPIVEGGAKTVGRDAPVPAESKILPAEATKPHVWPEHAPLRERAEEPPAAPEQTQAPQAAKDAMVQEGEARKAAMPALASAHEARDAQKAPAREAVVPAPSPAPPAGEPQAREPEAGAAARAVQAAAPEAASATQTLTAEPAQAEPAKVESSQAEPAKAGGKSVSEAAAPAYKGGRVVNIAAVEGPADYRVYLTTSAPVEKVQVFAKKSPPAVGLDLFGPWTAPPQASIPGGEQFVDRLRIGAHPDKLRIMIDLRSEQISRKATVETLKNGVVIILGK